MKSFAAAALSVLAFSVPHASAQSDPKPYTYMSGAIGPVTAGEASQMVVVPTVDLLTPAEAAIAARTTADNQIQSGRTHPDHICILIHNFGSCKFLPSPPNPPNQLAASSLFHEADKLTNPAPQFTTQNPHPSWPYMQPWLTAGTEQAKAWMEQFVQAYNDPLLPAPAPIAPARFHFDLEDPIIGCCEIDMVRILEAVSLQPRWSTEEVSGFPGQTMAQLFQQAVIDFGWVPGPPPGSPIVHTLGANRDEFTYSDTNRKYFLWYHRICQRARDAAMNEAAYEVIKAAWPECKVSNYEDINADGREDDFGWHYDWNNGGTPGITTRSVRGQTPLEPEGRRNIWSDLLYPATPTLPASRSLWYVPGASASGDFSAPVLYTHSPIYAAIPATGNCGMDASAINPYCPQRASRTSSPSMTPHSSSTAARSRGSSIHRDTAPASSRPGCWASVQSPSKTNATKSRRTTSSTSSRCSVPSAFKR